MKKLITSCLFCLAILSTRAQVKIFNGGNVSLGSISIPETSYKLHVRGNSIFAAIDSSIQSAAFIRGMNLYSSVSTPDYTWHGDNQTGLFHPTNNNIGFSIGGNERMRLSNGGLSIIAQTNTSALVTNCVADVDYAWAHISYVHNPTTKNWIVSYNGDHKFFVTSDGGAWSRTARLTGDTSLLENITTLSNAKNKVLALRGVSFNYKPETLTDPEDTTTILPTEYPDQIGLIAQEVEEVVPEVVATDSSSGLKAIAYSNLVGLLVEAFKEQQLTIDSLHGVSPGTCDVPVTMKSSLVMNLDTNNIYYGGQDVAKSRIGIGYLCEDKVPAKLSVSEAAGEVEDPTIAGYFHNGDTSSDITGVQIEVDGAATGIEESVGIAAGLDVRMNTAESTQASIGINVLVNGTTMDAKGEKIEMTPDVTPNGNGYAQSIGLRIYNAPNYINTPTSTKTFGIRVSTEGYVDEADTIGENKGIWSEASNGKVVLGVGGTANGGTKINIGVGGETYGGATDANYGVYGRAGILSCSTSTCADAAGFFVGDVGYTGSAYNVSDAKLKENIQPLSNSISVLNQLNPKIYSFKNADYPTVNTSKSQRNAGLLAQEVEKVLPELVKSFKVLPPFDTATHSFDQTKVVDVLAVNYSGLIPYLIQGIKDQQQTINEMKQAEALSLDSMRDQLEQLKAIVSNCCAQQRNSEPQGSNNDPASPVRSALNMELENVNSIILNQNDPNPFTEHTNIAFNIPDDVKDAKIIFFDNLGRILKTVVISERGAGQLNVFSSSLSSGIYSYSLLTDGNVAATKKMVKQN